MMYYTASLLWLSAMVVIATSSSSPWSSAPPGCRWRREMRDPRVPITLDCHVRSVQDASSLLSHLAPHQVGKLDALAFSCDDKHPPTESLRLDELIPLGRRLRGLAFDKCGLRYIPAMVFSQLTELAELAVRTSKSDVDFHVDSFADLKELRRLELVQLGASTLPGGVFCPLFTLKVLNLTGNRLRDISEVGFSDWGEGPTAPGRSCNTGLRVLDLSHNRIDSLTDHSLSSLRSLETLDLRGNVIASVGDRSFVGLTSLAILDLNDNRLDDVPPELFRYTRKIKQILISNNTVKSLAPDVFQGLDMLQVLDLSRNDLTQSFVNRETFVGLDRLKVLNLAHNRLSRLDTKLFQDVRELRELYLDGNAIETLNGGVFNDLKELNVLSLSQNRFTVVDEFPFSTLYALKLLNLDDNRIESVHDRSFENVTNLSTLVLSGNRLKSVPASIRRLLRLEFLDIGKNDIENVDGSSFDGLQHLYGLRMVDNKLTNISKDAFASLPSLGILNMASNKIERIEPGTFNSNRLLTLIKLQENRLSDIAGVFDKMPSLSWLNISDNRVSRFDYAHLPPGLEVIDVHKNNISKLENVFNVSSEKLVWLDASFNAIERIDDLAVPDNVQSLNLKDNRISSVAASTFFANRDLKKVVLYGNRLTSLEHTAFILSSNGREVPQFFIGANPYVCDCTMEWVQNVNKWNHIKQYPRFADLDSVTCRTVHGHDEIRSLLELPSSQFLCPYESHCSNQCRCCDYIACDCKMICPDRCSCYHDGSWSSNVIDCSHANYTDVPKTIPMDATEIYLDGNNLGALGSHIFIGRKKLSVLHLNNSNIESIDNSTFNGLYSLKTLNLANNHIMELKGRELNQTRDLKELYLDHNEITHIDDETFAALTSLTTLHLQYNRLQDPHRSGFLPKGDALLEGNLWTCDCESVFSAEKWLKSTPENVKNMFCANESNPNIVTLSDAVSECYRPRTNNNGNELPSSESKPSAFKEADTEINYVPLLSIVLIAVILICLLGALVFAFRQDVRLWAHSKYGVRIFKQGATGECELDKDRMYDGYIVYSVLDDDFVTRILAPELEQSGYSMCLHYRDLQISSENYLNETLMNATEASKRLILVVSFNFLQNEWSRPSFKRAIKSTIEAIAPVSLRRHKVVFVLTTDVSALNVDADLQAFFKHCTVILWSEKRFWEKIRFAMPDIANLQWNKNGLKTTTANSHHQAAVVANGSGRRSQVSRYTSSPTSLDQWYKYAAVPPQPMVHHHHHHHHPTMLTTPEDDASLLTSTTLASQQYEGDPLNHSYVSIDTHCYEGSRRGGRPPLDDQGYLRPRPAPPPHVVC